MTAPLDLDQLQSFCAIADCGSFTEAARRVHKTQSAVSMQIKRLEERLGHDLLVRDGRGVSLTHYGDELYARAAMDFLHFQQCLQNAGIERVFVFENIGVQDADAFTPGRGFPGQRKEIGVNFNAQNCAGEFGQPAGQAARAAAHFQNKVLTCQLGCAHHNVQEIEIDKKILPQLLFGMKMMPFQEVPQVGKRLPRRRGADGHMV